jgi:hypothetical protein
MPSSDLAVLYFDEPEPSPVACSAEFASRLSLGNYTNAFFVDSAIFAVAPGSLAMTKRTELPVSSYFKEGRGNRLEEEGFPWSTIPTGVSGFSI